MTDQTPILTGFDPGRPGSERCVCICHPQGHPVREAAQPAPLDERYRALVGKLDAMNIGGHPLAGYSAQRRLGWDEAMATVRALIREDSDD